MSDKNTRENSSDDPENTPSFGILDSVETQDLIHELSKRFGNRPYLIAHWADKDDSEADWYSYWDGDFTQVTGLLKFVEWDIAENFAATYLYEDDDEEDVY